MQTKVHGLLTVKQLLELALASARASVTAQEQVVASMLERLTATAPEPDLAEAKGAEASILGGKKLVKKTNREGDLRLFLRFFT